MTRPSWDEYWHQMAATVATRSTCPRAAIGAVLVKDKRLIGSGYNGAPAGEPHCPNTPEHLALDHCERARHAEINALRNALIPVHGAEVYVVGQRRICPDCSDALRAAGVEQIHWLPSVPTLTNVLAEVTAWQRVTFPAATPASVAEHLRREAIELAANPTDALELADVMILAAGLADQLGVDLAEIVAEKLAINRYRSWGKPDDQGVVEHIRNGATP